MLVGKFPYKMEHYLMISLFAWIINIQEGENKSLIQEQRVIFMCTIVIIAILDEMCR